MIFLPAGFLYFAVSHGLPLNNFHIYLARLHLFHKINKYLRITLFLRLVEPSGQIFVCVSLSRKKCREKHETTE